MTKQFNGINMKGIASEDNRQILKANAQGIELFVDDQNKVWTSGEVYIADVIDTTDGDGLYCMIGNLVPVAVMRENDELTAKDIDFYVNPDTFEITASDGIEVSYGDTPKSASEAFNIIGSQWGNWNTFVWLAEYDENGNITSTNKI